MALAGLLTCVMLTTFVHPYLFRRDEPREAEIARETLVDNHWITPHLCGLPFLEKPPLYYDLVAAAFAVTGSITPSVARSVSIAFGAITIVTVLIFGFRWGGARRGWLAALILIGMPEFFKYNHLIVLDIAVAAFVTLAMAAFTWWLFWSANAKQRLWLLNLFYLAAAGAFLTKGLVGVFHIAVTVTAFCLVTRRWSIFAGLFRPLPMLLFALPVGVWLLLFYREGGIGYLHEHFINNIIGRFLGIPFQLSDVRFGHTDVGTPRDWSFYLSNVPRVLGLAVVFLPFAIWRTIRERSRASLAEDRQDYSSTRDLPRLLAICTLLPPVLLSFSANKETSYVLPSCVPAALIVAWWLDEHVLPQKAIEWRDVGCLAIILPAAAANVFGLGIDVRTYQVIAILVLIVAAAIVAGLLWKRRLESTLFASLGTAICFAVLSHSPTIDAVDWGFGRTMSDQVWSQVGQADLYLYHPDDIVRGCVPFYQNRLVREIDRPGELQRLLACKEKVFVLMRTQILGRLRATSLVSDSWRLRPLPDLDERHRYVLVSNAGD